MTSKRPVWTISFRFLSLLTAHQIDHHQFIWFTIKLSSSQGTKRYSSYPLSEQKSDIVNVGWDAIAVDTNLKCGQFRHKRQSLEQSAIQSQIVDTVNEELSNMEKNPSFKESYNNRRMKGDRDSKTRLMVAMINFK